ncbi:hypothetical protein BU25DRAFT_41881 [Macroventuria anomochaeta]|uniref:Uncharacterized protein n=1 Tax=Macroventuria anomochaeta TaxID=301207 RepID=A0ACB6S2F0_9PLEO|nr:uncharacterized protein BU25DRAFT_41881 [Macroventuria anomochaeta]KAF2628204.1 hypothetical protein BU25DRAFT_41881 [Macroventuria anomochaeta]
MGSRATKVAAPPHVKAAASPVAPAQQHHERSNKTNETGPCQDQVHQAARKPVTSPQPCDDINLKFSAQTTTTSRRRYSEPVQTEAMATELNTDGIRHLSAFESFIVERDLMVIDIDYAALVSPVPIEQLPSLAAFVPIQEEFKEPEEPEVQCIGCCTQLPKEKDLNYAQEVIKPCRSCNSTYCIPCVKGMFLTACKDSSRMPPRCCVQIHLYHIKPHLTIEEITEYKSKYEEWSTPKPFYCPIPTCSAFIPERLLPQQAGTKGKRKVDSGIGTPTLPNFQCPKCEGEICVDCRQSAHPDSLCTTLDPGVDAETAALLMVWGYKRCPKCSQGLKRMYGCNHMECRCGAHFCWGCMKSRDECEGGCYEDDDEDSGSDFEPDEPESLRGSDNNTATEAQTATAEGTEATMADAAPEVLAGVATETNTTSPVTCRPRNLDGGSARYWEQQDFDFGEEPTDDVQDRVWECHHSFEPYTITLTEAISKPPLAHEMECVKCWCAIQPDIETPQKSTTIPAPAKIARIPAGRGRGGRCGRGRGMVARLRPAAYVPPRGLVHSDATVGTAPHLTAQLTPVTLWTSETRSDPMEDIQSELEVDFKKAESSPDTELYQKAPSTCSTSLVFSGTSMAYSVAQECHNCSLLVCQKCADDILAQRQAKREAREAERAAEEAEAERKAEEET